MYVRMYVRVCVCVCVCVCTSNIAITLTHPTTGYDPQPPTPTCNILTTYFPKTDHNVILPSRSSILKESHRLLHNFLFSKNPKVRRDIHKSP
jgi:hypothetical protein